MTKLILIKTAVLLLLLYNTSYCILGINGNDSTETKAPVKYKWESILVSVKAGSNVYEPSGQLNTGFAASAGIGLGLGSDFYLKPLVSYFQAKTKGKDSAVEHCIGYMISLEHIMYSDNINFTISFGAGVFSANDSERLPGILTEFGLIYPLDNTISIYAGAGYMNIIPLDFGGLGKAYNNLILSAGIYFFVE